jgi:hypothetical protein
VLWGVHSPFTVSSSSCTVLACVCGLVLGVAGWNSGRLWLGMLLGPEKTSCVVFFRVAPAVDRLTPACGVWVVVVVVVGCGCLLSVA